MTKREDMVRGEQASAEGQMEEDAPLEQRVDPARHIGIYPNQRNNNME